MDVRLINYIVILFLGVFFSFAKNSDLNRKWYIIIILSLFILESCFRSLSVGNDTYSYYLSFKNLEYESWQNIFERFGDTYLRGEGKDPGYNLLVKCFQLIFPYFHFFLFAIACLFFIPLGIILYRYSTHILQLVFAFILFASLFQIITLSGIRQQIAMGFSFIAFLFLIREKYYKFFITILIGSFIHISLLLFLFLFLVKVFVNRKVKLLHWLTFLIIPIVIISSSSLVLFMASFLKNDYYQGYAYSQSEGNATTYVILVELISLICLLLLGKKFLNSNRENNTFYANLPLLTLFSPLILLDGALIRIGQYFTIYLMLLVPFTFDFISKQKKWNFMLYSFSILLLMYFSLNNTFAYYFFWQSTPYNLNY